MDKVAKCTSSFKKEDLTSSESLEDARSLELGYSRGPAMDNTCMVDSGPGHARSDE